MRRRRWFRAGELLLGEYFMSDVSNPAGSQSLGIGGIVGEAFSLTFRNFFQLLLIMIVPLLVVGVVYYLMFGNMIMAAMDPFGPQPQMDFGPTQMLMVIVSVLLAILAYCFLYGAAITAFFDAKMGRGISIGKAMSTGVSRAIQLFVSMLVLTILLGIVMVIVQIVVGLVAASLGSPVVAIVIMIGMLVFYVWIMALFVPFPAAVVVENLWIGAIGRSMELTKGYRWWIVLMFILFALAIIVLELILFGIMYVVGSLGMVGLYIGLAVGVVFAVVVTASSVGIITLCYARLREIKEGTSLDSLAQLFD